MVVESVRPLERSSSQGNIVHTTPAATEAACSHNQAFSESRGTSDSGEVACMDSSNTNVMATPLSDSAPSRSGSTSRIPVLPRAGPLGLKNS